MEAPAETVLEEGVESRMQFTGESAGNLDLRPFVPQSLEFNVIEYAYFGPMLVATVEVDADHCAYVLVPADWMAQS